MARVVLVTGGSSGIGRAIARRFVADGDRVVITGRSEDTLTRCATEIGAQAVRCDGTEPADVAQLVAELADRLDVIVNMAGGNTDLDSIRSDADTMTLRELAAAWRANLDANLLSTVLTTTGVLPAIPAGGTIITVSSIGAEYATTSYGAAKAAVAAWTAGLSPK
jgi:3-oxoacyl-[acyl-carrier protein] reductase